MNSRGSSVMFTINYKTQTQIDNETLKGHLLIMKGLKYAVFQLEQGENGTIHHQGFIVLENRKRFETINNWFNKISLSAHLETVKGKLIQAYEYCTGTGDFEYKRVNEKYTDKGGIVLSDFVEIGTLPSEKKEKPTMQMLYKLIKEGKTLNQIYNYAYQNDLMNGYVKNMQAIEKLVLQEQSLKYQDSIRKVNVRYLSGKTGIGKTRYIYDKCDFKEIYVITDYKNPFDNYKGQRVIVFDEFRESIKLEKMLHLLDIYPLELPARFYNRYACYTEIYIISNWSLTEQYKHYQDIDRQAFLRRIHFKTNDLNKLKEYDLECELPF